MRTRDMPLVTALVRSLASYSTDHRSLPGIARDACRKVLAEQMIESKRRVQYMQILRTRTFSRDRIDPMSELFSPLHAAIVRWQDGEKDEAIWLVFLATHFGKNGRTGWSLMRGLYGSLEGDRPWTWQRVSSDTQLFRNWLGDVQNVLKEWGNFGNHRKYQSLDAWKAAGTGAAVASYVDWIGPPRTHEAMIKEAMADAGGNPSLTFDLLYQSMSQVISFGRTAKFDFLTAIGNLGFAPIEPGSPYLHGATGPYRGCKLLFGERATVRASRADLNQWLAHLGGQLGVGMQVMEDALCNWQKSPDRFRAFRG
jgi:hypothetical protein